MFNYYLPGLTKSQLAPGDKLDHDLLRACGLAEVLADVRKVEAEASVVECRIGPDGNSGCVIAPVRKHTGPPDAFYVPGVQTWQPRQGCGAWIGWTTQEPPSVQSLERWRMVFGHEVQDRQGNPWMIPIARSPHGGYEFGTLPQTYSFDPTSGEPVPHLDVEFQWLWELSGRIRDWFRQAAGPRQDATPEEQARHEKPPFSWVVKQAARVIGVNYRVGLAELTVLHGLGLAVLTQETVRDICQTVYGWEIEEEAKKKPLPPATASGSPPAPNWSSSATGASTPDGAPGTGPATEP